ETPVHIWAVRPTDSFSVRTMAHTARAGEEVGTVKVVAASMRVAIGSRAPACVRATDTNCASTVSASLATTGAPALARRSAAVARTPTTFTRSRHAYGRLPWNSC